MFDISKLVESGAISEDVQKSIQEAWDSKIKENKETVGAELREEFAKRYEHDKGNMIEAIDKMMSEKLSEEISKFIEDRKALAQEKIAYKENVGAHSAKLQEFVLTKLSEELKELHGDRKGVHSNFGKMEEFVVNALAKEIKEFHEDKKGVVETKVKLVAEAKAQMAKLKEAFIQKSAKVVESAVNKKLAEELSTLKALVVEDNEINQLVIKEQLREVGLPSEVAVNGVEAVDKVKHSLAEKTPYAMIFMDCHMPVMGGLEATQKIRALGEQTKDVPIIALTANVLTGDKEKCLKSGMNDFISKPVGVSRLKECVFRHLSKQLQGRTTALKDPA